MEISALRLAGFSAAAPFSGQQVSSITPQNLASIVSEQDEFAAQMDELQQYLKDRDDAYRAQHGDTPQNAVAVAMPYIPGMGTPFVTASQQRLIDSITMQYADNPGAVIGALNAQGVGPYQIVQSAQYFIDTDGVVRDRDGQLLFGHLVDMKA